MSAAPSKWRIEQQAKSGLGTLMWLPVGETMISEAEAERQATRLYGHNGLPTRVVEVKP